MEQKTRIEEIAILLSKKKGLVCKELEKVSPTEAAFNRMVKEMHNIFDSLETDLFDLLDRRSLSIEEIAVVLSKKKGMVCKEFEKICPTEASFNRMVKEMHNIFDGLEADLVDQMSGKIE